MLKHRRRRIIFFFIVLLISTICINNTVSAQETLSCSHDLDNDGDVDSQGEMASCIQTDDGNSFCSIAAVDCVVVQEDATCPEGTNLNSDTQHCEGDPICSSGTYDSNAKACILETAAICPEGSELDGSTDQCQVEPTCEAGTYDPTVNRCIETTVKTCPIDTTFNPSTNKCEAEPECETGTFNKTYNSCVYNDVEAASCPSVASLVTSRDQCEASPYCETGTFDGSANLCIASVTTNDAECPEGTDIDLTQDICKGNASCSVAGTVYDEDSKLCIADPTCTLGGYDPTLNQCYLTGTADILASDTISTMFAATGDYACEQNVARQGRYDTCTLEIKHDEAVERIISILETLGIAADCPENTELDQTTHLCTAHSLCPDGTTLDLANNNCTSVPDCAEGIYDASVNKCIIPQTGTSSAVCPDGSETLEGSSDKCVSDVLCSMQGMEYNPDTNKCETAISCISGTYDTARNSCYVEAQVSCPSGATFIPSLGKCQYLVDTYTTPTCKQPNMYYNPPLDRCCIGASCPNTPLYQVNCPSGASLDGWIDKCVGLASQLCAVGSYYNSSTQKCQSDPVCSYGGAYDSYYSQCVVDSCTSPATYSNGKCVTDPYCTEGTLYWWAPNAGHGAEGFLGCTYTVWDYSEWGPATCDQGSPNPATGKCESTSICSDSTCYYTPTCTQGTLNTGCCTEGTYVSSSNQCVYDSCSEGETYNSTTGKCDYTPTSCTLGDYYTWSNMPTCFIPDSSEGGWGLDCRYLNCAGHGTLTGCEASYFSGYTGTSKCESTAKCSASQCSVTSACSGGADTGTDKCESNPCTSGTFNPSTLRCEANVICPKGSTYDSTIQNCSTNVVPTCVSGTQINYTTDACEAEPTCVSTSFIFINDRCEASPTCPYEDYLYDTNLNYCVEQNTEADAVCPEGTSLNNDTDFCEGPLSCASGTTYNYDTKECESTPSCSNGILSFTSFPWLNDAPTDQFAICDFPTSTSAAQCKAGTILDTDLDRCTDAVDCPDGAYFNQYTLWCVADPDCPDAGAYYYPSLGICVSTVNADVSCEDSDMTFSPTKDLCISSPECSRGTYDSVNDNCKVNLITSADCPSGTSLASTGKCSGDLDCEDGVWDDDLNQCVNKTWSDCVSGTSLEYDTDLCQTSPDCEDNSGEYYSELNECLLVSTPTCTTTTFYFDSSIDKCTSIPTCSLGNFDPETGMCKDTGGDPVEAECTGNLTLNSSSDQCEAEPTCASGAYNPYLDKCSKTVSCSSGSYNSITNKCDSGAAPCSNGMTLDSLVDVCVIAATCTSGQLDSSSEQCSADPICTDSAYDPTINMCVPFIKSCPYNTDTETYECPLVGGVQKCSADPCMNDDGTIPAAPEDDITDDGEVDEETGECLGQVRIFDGSPQRCLKPGQRALTADCCEMPIPEDVYNETSNPYYRFQSVGYLNQLSTSQLKLLTDYLGIFDGGCTTEEGILNIAKQDKLTHYIGEYCLVKWLSWCAQKAQMQCMFNSTLSRIVQEQGRSQLERFQPDGGWGTPEDPNCEGFTLEEFMMLDFSQMDLSEFADLIAERVQTTMAETMAETAAETAAQFLEQTLPTTTGE